MKNKFNLTFLILAASLPGCETKEVALSMPKSTVLIDSRTQETFTVPVPESYPEVNPNTGQRTLVPALYCSECNKWYPVPPPELINRIPNSAICPKSHGPLSADGPRPPETTTTSGMKP